MTKSLVIISLLTLAVMVLTDDRGLVNSWEGSLQLFGNEPFTKVALITDSQERWFLDMDEQAMNQLWNDNRGRVRISGIESRQYFQGKPEKFITVKEYEWVNDTTE